MKKTTAKIGCLFLTTPSMWPSLPLASSVAIALIISTILGVSSSAESAAKPDPVRDVLKKHDVKLHRTEKLYDEKNYYVDLPFDPNVKKLGYQLEKDITVANECHTFVLHSRLDRLKIRVTAHLNRAVCTFDEFVEPE